MGTKDAGRGLYDLLVRLGLETGFGAVGMPEDGIEAAAETISGMVFPNPAPPPTQTFANWSQQRTQASLQPKGRRR